MAKQMKRFGPYAGAVTIVVLLLLFSSLAQPDPPGDPPGNPELAWAARHSLGFGPHEVLPALVGDRPHRRMIQVGLGFARQGEGVLAPLVEDQREARAELVRCLTWEEDPAAAYEQLEQAQDAITEVVQDLLSQLRRHVPTPHGGLIARLALNRHLDPELRTLNLTFEQRQTIIAAQRVRDTVIRSARNWYNRTARQEAGATFEDSLQSILTAPQRAALAAVRQVLADRREEMAAAEAEEPGDD